MNPTPSHPGSRQQSHPPLRWDIFCQVIDNFGDIGVCWRLAANLAARGQQVRLWLDDASALAWMAPQEVPGVQVLPWPVQVPEGGMGEVVVEAFGCAVAPAVLAAMAQQAQQANRAPASGRTGGERGFSPVWINLEYLSAEPYVERCHALPSPVFSGPGAGLTRHFFYPGFTAGTGGLLREPDLLERQAQFDRSAWRERQGVAASARVVALFCYEPVALPALLEQLACAAPHSHLLVTPGRATAAVQALETGEGPQRPNKAGRTHPAPDAVGAAAAIGAANAALPAALENPQKSSLQGRLRLGGQLSISYLPAVDQAQFDHLLWASDLNLVRGEDSLVRALWAGQPLVWQIYPQGDMAHHGKLHAFLDWLQAPASLRRFHAVWNGVETGPLPTLDASTLQAWAECVQAARARLLAQANLATQLLGFVDKRR